MERIGLGIEYNLTVCTWNCKGKAPKDIDFAKLLENDEIQEAQDIVVVGFQEIVN